MGTFGDGLFGEGLFGVGEGTGLRFTPPRVSEGMGTDHPLFRYYKIDRGVSVLVTGSTVRQVQYPSQEDVEAADFAYLGGHIYDISDAEAATLTAAGYGAYIS